MLISYCTSKHNIKKDEKIQNIISSSSSNNSVLQQLMEVHLIQLRIFKVNSHLVKGLVCSF